MCVSVYVWRDTKECTKICVITSVDNNFVITIHYPTNKCQDNSQHIKELVANCDIFRSKSLNIYKSLCRSYWFIWWKKSILFVCVCVHKTSLPKWMTFIYPAKMAIKASILYYCVKHNLCTVYMVNISEQKSHLLVVSFATHRKTQRERMKPANFRCFVNVCVVITFD